MASKGLSLKQTKGTFQVTGKIIGVGKDKFYDSKKTKNNANFRIVQFGVRVSKDSIVYLTLNGMEQQSVYFSKRSEVKGEKGEVKTVEWSKRNTFKQEGFTLIGVNLGLTKKIDEKGIERNDIQHLTPFDACDYIRQNMKDDMDVFIRGTIEYSHFESNGNTVHAVKLIPNQISLCAPIDFEEKDFKPTAVFSQVVVLSESETNEKKPDIVKNEDGSYSVISRIVNYNNIETATFIVRNEKLINNIGKLKPYTLLSIFGDIETVRNTDEVKSTEDDSGWGTPDPTKVVRSPYQRIFVVTGADPESIDPDTYNKKNMEVAMEEVATLQNKEEGFKTQGKGKSDDEDWGSKDKKPKIEGNDDEDSDNPWED